MRILQFDFFVGFASHLGVEGLGIFESTRRLR